ncbi:antitoxin [Pseudonocardia bannensis]|uniref:Antitoxin n=2 Tax=Pseudonocardia bannensis TaxID=630973 RepID=A0A848DC36_9PSEU|nr:antitoxin [Pseudonocardia bannensis]
MVDFNALRGKAEELLNAHGDKVEDATEKVGDLVKGKFGHDEQVDQVVDKLKDLIPDGPGGVQAPTTGQ